jgi:hypothetical protein
VAALCRSDDSHAETLDAVNAVLEAGIPGEGVRVLTVSRSRGAVGRLTSAGRRRVGLGAERQRLVDEALRVPGRGGQDR